VGQPAAVDAHVSAHGLKNCPSYRPPHPVSRSQVQMQPLERAPGRSEPHRGSRGSPWPHTRCRPWREATVGWGDGSSGDRQRVVALGLTPGTCLRRVDLHARYGGRRQGGISPSRSSSNVFLFADSARGRLHGYLYDGPRSDGFYHYTGEGQLGDQQMVQGNRTVRDHAAEGRDLCLFEVDRGKATYIGRFEYVDHYLADAPETGGGDIRSVIVFRLRQLEGVAPQTPPARADELAWELVKEVPVEQHLTERFVIEGSRAPCEAERREQRLVRQYLDFLEGRNHEVCRLQLRPRNEPTPLLCDLFDKTTQTLVEAKGSVARPAIRMAIGQLADYARLKPGARTAILVPQRPRSDLLDLADSQGIDVIWPEAEGFRTQPARRQAPRR